MRSDVPIPDSLVIPAALPFAGRRPTVKNLPAGEVVNLRDYLASPTVAVRSHVRLASILLNLTRVSLR
jgi:hypothetical protein